MTNNDFDIRLTHNASVVKKALRDFRDEMFRAVYMAGREASAKILNTTGVKKYPAEPTTRHSPPSAYLRGIGYIRKDGSVSKGSERYGTQWNVKSYKERMITIIGNRASYAPFLGGDDQARNINKNIPGQGWQKLGDVADDKINQIAGIYNEWIKRALKKVGLI